MLELVSVARFPPETLDSRCLVHILMSSRNDLERHLLEVKGIAGAIDRSHTAQTD